MGAGGTCSFVGSHLDVVPANPETWEVAPFKLTVDGDKLTIDFDKAGEKRVVAAFVTKP